MIRYFVILFFSLSVFVQAKADNKSKKTSVPKAEVSSEEQKIFSEYFSTVIDTETQKTIDLNNIKTPYSFWVFFQENCQSCQLMFKELSCLPKKKVTSHVVGVLSEPAMLLKEARSHAYKGPVYYSKNLIERRLDLEVTPTVFLFKGGELITRADNFVSCADLKSKLL